MTYIPVNGYPSEVNEVLVIERWAFGLASCVVICCLLKRIDGWCVYAWPKYLPDEYVKLHGRTPSFMSVLEAGEKMPEAYARELFPGMQGPYAH